MGRRKSRRRRRADESRPRIVSRRHSRRSPLDPNSLDERRTTNDERRTTTRNRSKGCNLPKSRRRLDKCPAWCLLARFQVSGARESAPFNGRRRLLRAQLFWAKMIARSPRALCLPASQSIQSRRQPLERARGLTMKFCYFFSSSRAHSATWSAVAQIFGSQI